MRKIELEPPQIQGRTAAFGWRVVPETSLYRRQRFTLEFPAGIDLARVPARLWWDILLICLHAHWLVLRPCTVVLPLRLAPGERAFWLQLLRSGADTLDARKGAAALGAPLGIEIADGDREVPRTPVAGQRCGGAFSGGKDSLLQAALLAELTERPLLVATTSPMPPLKDHETERRRQVFAAIQARRQIQFVEVKSDLRSAWNNAFGVENGYGVGINELGDTFLYLASLLAAGAASGATRLFLASEAEVQENVEFAGTIVQHTHFMYSAATQRALSRLLAPYGISYGSLTWPLYSHHVQKLLWERYPDLADLQYSCWRVGAGEAACSACGQCFRIAMNALASGHDPQRMGIDLERLLESASNWPPRVNGASVQAALPDAIVSRRFEALVRETIRRTSLLRVGLALARRDPRRVFTKAGWRSLGRFRAIRRRAAGNDPPPRIGVREAFCDWLDPGLREGLVRIFRQHLPLEPRADHIDVFHRSAALTARATAGLT